MNSTRFACHTLTIIVILSFLGAIGRQKRTRFMLMLARHGIRYPYHNIEKNGPSKDLAPQGREQCYQLGLSLRKAWKDFFSETYEP